MKKHLLTMLVLAFVGSAGLFAQSADKVTQFIQADKATWGNVCYLTGTYLGLIEEDASYEDALKILTEKGIALSGKSADDVITISEQALVYSKTWNIKNSLMYLITKDKRYAFRQLQAAGIISKTADPSKITDGHEAINLFNTCMERYSKEEQ
jgi:hypothetical protein